MSGKILRYCVLLPTILFLFSFISSGQSKGLLFDDLAFKQNVRKQYIGPAFQDEVLPGKVSLRSHCPVPGYQGNMGSCVGWAVGYGAYTISDAIRKGIKNRSEISALAFSPLYLYNQVKISDCEKGAYIDKALTFSKQKGDCLFSLFNPPNCSVQPSDELQTTKIVDFQALFYGNESQEVRLYSVKQKLKDQFPVIIGFETNDRFSSQFITKTSPVWVSGGSSTGGHAVVIVGYDDSKMMFEVLNSWGSSFGDDGFFWMKYDDFLVYTHYAAILTLPPVSRDEIMQIEGSATLRYFDRSMNRLEDVNVSKENSYNYSTFQASWHLGDIFQLRIKNKLKNEYVYVFSIDNSNKPTIHFPRRTEFGNINSNDSNLINESEFFTSVYTTLAIPNDRTGMQLNTTSDLLCVLFSKIEIKDFDQIVADVAQQYVTNHDLSEALTHVLPNRLRSIHDITYSSNDMKFESSAEGRDVVPIIIRLDATNNK